jgi:small subunit ribosomal protein S17
MSESPTTENTGMTQSTTAVDDKARGVRKFREGLVVSDKMNKTVVVAVEDRVQHPLYKKTLRRTNKLKAHDEQNACGIGDRVLLMETRPLSASKRWRVVEILEKAK